MKRKLFIICVSVLVLMAFHQQAEASSFTFMDTYNIVDPGSGGSVNLEVWVLDNAGGDYSMNTWYYGVDNIDYDPIPGTSNGLSGFQLVFTEAITEFADQTAPNANWQMNAFSGQFPPWAAEWDITNTGGLGVMPGDKQWFSLTTGIREVVVADTGGWMHSWINDGQSSTFSLGEIATPGAKVPEPSTLLLFGTGLIGIGIFRRKFKV